MAGADFGLYQGLQRKSNIFETKAANRQMEIAIVEQQDIRAKQKLQESAEVDAKIQEFFDTMNQLDVLEQDKDNIDSAERRYRADVINGIKQYNGDLSQFMLSGGAGTLASYRNNLLNSEEVRTAISNKTNYAQWMNAQANGLWVKDVGVEVDVMDPETGEMRKEQKKVTMDEAYALYENGQIESLPWDGAEQDIDVGPEMFQAMYKDPRNPYSQDTEVSPQDVYLWTLEHGGSEDQAIKKMNKYVQYRDGGGTPWRYKSGDMLNYQIKKQQLANMRQSYKQNAAAGAKGPENLTPIDVTMRLKTGKPGDYIPILPQEVDFWTKQLGITKDEDGNYKVPAGVELFDREDRANPDPKVYDSATFDSMIPAGYTITPSGKVMLKFTASYEDSGWFENEERPAGENFWGWDGWNDGASINNFTKSDGDKWTGEVYMPVDRLISDQYFATSLNQAVDMNWRDTQEMPYVVNNYKLQLGARQYQDAANQFRAAGVPEEMIDQYMLQYVTNDPEAGTPYGAADVLHEQTQP
jgi:hypothetical protein